MTHRGEFVGERGFPTARVVGLARDALQAYARVIGNIRRELTPPQKHWWHITLLVSARGLTTTPISSGEKTFELTLNPTRDRVESSVSDGGEETVSLAGQSQRALHNDVLATLADLGAPCSVSFKSSDTHYGYAGDAARRYWQALSQIDAIYKEFKGSLREETGPVQIFPHHFDVSLNWFSGRLIPGADPADAEHADEQMNLGFVTGDGSVPEAYFYATAYPTPDGLTDAALPTDAHWHTEGFAGAVLYEQLANAADPRGRLLEFQGAVHEAGSSLMRLI